MRYEPTKIPIQRTMFHFHPISMLTIILLVLAGVASAQTPTISWTLQASNASYPVLSTGYAGVLADPVSGTIIVPEQGATNESGSIFTGAWYAYCPPGMLCASSFGGTNKFVLMNRDSNTYGNAYCSIADSSHWGNAHFYRQTWTDTLQSPAKFYLALGTNMDCTGTGVNSSSRPQMYHFNLNADPTLDTTIVQDSSYPITTNTEGMAAMDTTANVYFFIGGVNPSASSTTNHNIYCPGSSVTAAQAAWGCTSNNTWQALWPSNGNATVTGGTTATVTTGNITDAAAGDVVCFGSVVSSWPPAGGPSQCQEVTVISGSVMTLGGSVSNGATSWTLYPSQTISGVSYYVDSGTQIYFDPASGSNGQILMFGGAKQSSNIYLSGTWFYDGQAHHWIHKGQSTITPIVDQSNADYPRGQTPTGFDPTRRRLWYQLACAGTGSATLCTGGTTKTYLYDIASDTWTLIDSGAGPGSPSVVGALMAYSGSCDCLVTYSAESASHPIMWVGQINEATTTGQFPGVASGGLRAGGVQ